MGNCDSSTENISIRNNPKQKMKKNYGISPSYYSSSSLPSITSSFFNQKDRPRHLKSNNSTEVTNPLENKQYILSERIAKRGRYQQKV